MGKLSIIFLIFVKNGTLMQKKEKLAKTLKKKFKCRYLI